jgi:trehalose 6-phosphate phosphatase
MPNLLDHFDSVKEVLALRPFGLFTDVDGTISEIAPSPGEARVSPVCREYLAILAGKLDLVAAVSGRTAAETREMVGVDGVVYIGNHGYERWTGGGVRLIPGVAPYVDRIKGALDELQRRVSIEGVIFENKGPTGSIHYRGCRDHGAALGAIMGAVEGVAAARDLKISLGKLVVELRPPLEMDKGIAVCSLAEERHLRGAIYLGDDLTDVDVFTAFHKAGLPFRGLAVAVIGNETAPEVAQEADFTLSGVGEVESFLRRAAA